MDEPRQTKAWKQRVSPIWRRALQPLRLARTALRRKRSSDEVPTSDGETKRRSFIRQWEFWLFFLTILVPLAAMSRLDETRTPGEVPSGFLNRIFDNASVLLGTRMVLALLVIPVLAFSVFLSAFLFHHIKKGEWDDLTIQIRGMTISGTKKALRENEESKYAFRGLKATIAYLRQELTGALDERDTAIGDIADVLFGAHELLGLNQTAEIVGFARPELQGLLQTLWGEEGDDNN
jgi:hypothetical protein